MSESKNEWNRGQLGPCQKYGAYWGPSSRTVLRFRPNPGSLEEEDAFFLQCEVKIVRRHTSRQRFGVASQQRLHPRRFNSTAKRVPKPRFAPVSFLFLVCFSITSRSHTDINSSILFESLVASLKVYKVMIIQ